MDNFCYGPLWNDSLSWNTSNPNLTPCLRDAIIPSIAFGLLWLSVPFWYFWVVNYEPKLRAKRKAGKEQSSFIDRLTFLFCSKLFFNIIVVLNGAGELAWRINEYQELYGSEVFFPIMVFFNGLLTLTMMLAEKKYLIRSSAPLSLFWPLFLITCLPNFKVEIESLLEDFDGGRLILTASLVPSAFILSVLNVWADNKDLEPVNADMISPNNMNSFLSAVALSWMDPLIWKGYKAPLLQSDLFNPPSKINVDSNVDLFQKYYQDYLLKNRILFRHHKTSDNHGRKRASIIVPMMKTFGWTFAFGNFLGWVHYSVTFIGPQLLKVLLAHIEDPEDHAWKGYFYATLMLIVYITSTIFFQSYLIHFYTVSLNARSVVISAITRKTLKLSNPARQKFTTGQITNLVSVDAQRIMETFPYLAILWAAPYQVILAMTFLYMELGPAALAGVAVLAILIPINAIGSKFGEILQRAQLKAKDSRVKLINEIFTGIKVLKLYAWEIPFINRILSIRDKELQVIKKNGILNALNNFTYSCSPILITLSAFSTYVLLNSEENILTPQKVFVSMALFNLIRFPLTLFPLTLREVIKTYVSVKRINDFMNAEELEEDAVTSSVQDPGNAVEAIDATLAWENDGRPILKNLNFQVRTGSLTAIVGTVGAGKSSILSAVLGEMEKLSGGLARQGSVAYVAQQAWIQNLTLRDNILFGKPFEASKYKQVIESCSLKTDLHILSQGDATEIGENGINLSGGQKQRVSLARAIYADCDIYLLDDPLSAVDAHVGKHIFDNVISNDEGSLLRNKTRVWVTNNLSYLTSVDNIIVIADGEMIEQGSFRDLVRNKSTLMSLIQQDTERRETELSSANEEDLVKNVLESNDSQDEEKEAFQQSNDDFANLIQAGQLVKDERSETGSVKFSVYLEYFKSLSYAYSALFFTLVAAQQGLHLGGNIWLSKWSDENNVKNADVEENSKDVTYYLMVYAVLGVIEVIIKLGNDLVFYFKCTRASKVIHKKLLNNVMRSPMSFFDTNPTGRIVNRFTSDLDTVVMMIPFGIMDFSWCLIECTVVIFLISYTTPLFISVIVPLMLIYFFIQRVYITTSRQLKRLYSISKSPIFSHFTEVTNGALTIRAYKLQGKFVQESQDRVSTNVKSVYLNFMSNRWLGMRLENIGNFVIFFSALFAIISKDSLTAGEAGLSITSSLQIIGALVWVVMVACQLESDCVAIERIIEYTRTKQEAPWNLPTNEKIHHNWPDKGTIQFHSYQTRYREGLDLVLKGIDMDVNSEEKVGICGRTGAGKSSLTLALFRIIEPAGGKIVIDGQDISLLGLHTLRSKLTIIPQDPVLFTGDLRFNLDPVGEHEDSELWKCLELAHLKEHVMQNLESGLDSQVSEAGSNFSVGQRQLICLARALLRKTKILVLDEATAAIDQETDSLIQLTIRKEFSDCTVLTIAHRLNTIMDSDRVAVFQRGTLEEFDSPGRLLNTDGSTFKAMASDSNLM